MALEKRQRQGRLAIRDNENEKGSKRKGSLSTMSVERLVQAGTK